ncbi:unnamed protein product [Ixodes hexagonus]
MSCRRIKRVSARSGRDPPLSKMKEGGAPVSMAEERDQKTKQDQLSLATRCLPRPCLFTNMFFCGPSWCRSSNCCAQSVLSVPCHALMLHAFSFLPISLQWFLLVVLIFEVHCDTDEVTTATTTTKPKLSFKLHRPAGFNKNGSRPISGVFTKRKPLFGARRLKALLEEQATSTESHLNVVPDFKKATLEDQADATVPTTTVFPPPPLLRSRPAAGTGNVPQVVPTEPNFNPDSFFTGRKKGPVVVVKRFHKGSQQHQSNYDSGASSTGVDGPPGTSDEFNPSGVPPPGGLQRPVPRPGYGYQPPPDLYGGPSPLDVLRGKGIPRFFSQRDIDFVAQAFKNAAANGSIPTIRIPAFTVPTANQTQQSEHPQSTTNSGKPENGYSGPARRVPESVLEQGYPRGYNPYPPQTRRPELSQYPVPNGGQGPAPGVRFNVQPPPVFQQPNGQYKTDFQPQGPPGLSNLRPQAGGYLNGIQQPVYPNYVSNNGYARNPDDDGGYQVDPRYYRGTFPVGQNLPQVGQVQSFNLALQRLAGNGRIHGNQQPLTTGQGSPQGRTNPGLLYQNYVPAQNLNPTGYSNSGLSSLAGAGYVPNGAAARGYRFLPIASNDRLVTSPDEPFANSFTPNQLVEFRDGRAIPVQPSYNVYPERTVLGYPPQTTPQGNPKTGRSSSPTGIRQPLYQNDPGVFRLDGRFPLAQKRASFGPGRDADFGYTSASHDSMYSYRPDVIPRCVNTSKQVPYCLHDDEYPQAALHIAVDLEHGSMHRLLPETPNGAASVDALFLDSGSRLASEKDSNATGSLAAESSTNATVSEQLRDDGKLYACPSLVQHARPLRAMTVDGYWKVVVNMKNPHGKGAFQQMVRTEVCANPGKTCSNVAAASRCVQKYNLHRLVVWTRQEGIHMDTFRMPVACSCYLGAMNKTLALKKS